MGKFKMKRPTFFSEFGYKKNSPDVNKPVNTIKSGDITMKGVEFKVRGEDNLGNVKIMKPGKNYKFPGNVVTETPLNKRGMWDNIHAKRKRGEAPAKPGDPDRPSKKEWDKNTK